MRILKLLGFALCGHLLGGQAFAQANFLAGIPRNEVLIAENPQGRITNPTWFNIWVVNHGGNSNGLQQLGMDTLWYIDADAGIDGVWDNSLASDKPTYNADFTEKQITKFRALHSAQYSLLTLFPAVAQILVFLPSLAGWIVKAPQRSCYRPIETPKDHRPPRVIPILNVYATSYWTLVP
jgi:hypothetical protein